MSAGLLISGTGTGIGKTHLAESLLLALRKRVTVVGWKPVESGVSAGNMGEDQKRLSAASSTGTRVPGDAHIALVSGVSPHLAAERQNVALPWDTWMHFARSFENGNEGVVIELAGGLFSPLSLVEDNATFVRRLRADALPSAKLVLCAPDRLGVLSELHSALLAATHVGVMVDAVVLMSTSEPDASTGSNRREFERTMARRDGPPPRVFGPMPRLPVSALSEHAELADLAELASFSS